MKIPSPARTTTLAATAAVEAMSGVMASWLMPWMARWKRRLRVRLMARAVTTETATRVPANQPWWGIQRRKTAAATIMDRVVRPQASSVRSGCRPPSPWVGV